MLLLNIFFIILLLLLKSIAYTIDDVNHPCYYLQFIDIRKMELENIQKQEYFSQIQDKIKLFKKKNNNSQVFI